MTDLTAHVRVLQPHPGLFAFYDGRIKGQRFAKGPNWVDYPSFPREMEILQARAPEASARLSAEVVAFVQRLRGEDLFKKPGVAETIDWAKCLLALDVIALSPEVIADTLGAILKYQDDIQKIQGSEAKRLLDEVRQTMTVA